MAKPPRVHCEHCGKEFYDGDAHGDYMGEGVYIYARSLNNREYGRLCNGCWAEVLRMAFAELLGSPLTSVVMAVMRREGGEE